MPEKPFCFLSLRIVCKCKPENQISCRWLVFVLVPAINVPTGEIRCLPRVSVLTATSTKSFLRLRSRCNDSGAPLPSRIKIQPFIRPNSCQQHKRQRLVKPSKQTQEADWMSAQLSSPPPPPLLCLLLFHYLNMTGSPCSLSKAGDRWNWWALRVQRETSGQARVIGGTKERCASGCSPGTLLASTPWIPHPFSFQPRLWAHRPLQDLMTKTPRSPCGRASDVKRAKLTGCLSSQSRTKCNARRRTKWEAMEAERFLGRASEAGWNLGHRFHWAKLNRIMTNIKYSVSPWKFAKMIFLTCVLLARGKRIRLTFNIEPQW